MLPDWDMFQSGHEWGAFHAAGRAVSGGPVYVSDKPGEHDVELLGKLVCGDGSVLRCDAPGLPTLDTLLVDPTRSPVPMKIWNRIGAAGLLGAFHALHDSSGQPLPVSGSVSPSDVVGLGDGPFACFAHRAGTLERLQASETRPVSLEARQWELFTFVPIRAGFAPIGLVDKLNSAGAIAALSPPRPPDGVWRLSLRDAGTFLAYAERAPRRVAFEGEELSFEHDAGTGRLSVRVPTAGSLCVEPA
jgi:raffinose synthase